MNTCLIFSLLIEGLAREWFKCVRALKKVQTGEKYHIKRQHEVVESPRLCQISEPGMNVNLRMREKTMRHKRHPRRDVMNEHLKEVKSTQQSPYHCVLRFKENN